MERHMKKICMVLILVSGILLMTSCGSPKNIEVEVECPVETQRGSSFDIIVTVRNIANKPQKLVSLDVGDRYLDGVAVVKTEPKFSESSHIPIDNSVSHVFNETIPANGELKVVVNAKAVKTGDFSDDLDVCVNTSYSFLTTQLRTVVSEQSVSPDGDI